MQKEEKPESMRMILSGHDSVFLVAAPPRCESLSLCVNAGLASAAMRSLWLNCSIGVYWRQGLPASYKRSSSRFLVASSV
jgi:hypothetical protein